MLAAFVLLTGVGDGTTTPVLTETARPVLSGWTDTLPDPPPGFVRFYDVEAEDAAGNRSEACS